MLAWTLWCSATCIWPSWGRGQPGLTALMCDAHTLAAVDTAVGRVPARTWGLTFAWQGGAKEGTPQAQVAHAQQVEVNLQELDAAMGVLIQNQRAKSATTLADSWLLAVCATSLPWLISC
jgi:hypothetical protein